MLTADDKRFIARALAMHAVQTRSFAPSPTRGGAREEVASLARQILNFCEAPDPAPIDPAAYQIIGGTPPSSAPSPSASSENT